MTIDRRRLVCPSLTRPMTTGDGCLARLAPLDAPLDAAGLAMLADASRRWGNGTVEVTRRGNFQCRGFPYKEDNAFRPVLGQLPGQQGSRFPISLDPVGMMSKQQSLVMRALYSTLHHKLSDPYLSSRMAPKISLVISAGGGVGHDTLAADIQLHVDAVAPRIAIHVGLGRSLTPGDMRWLGMACDVEGAVSAVETLLALIADEGALARARAVPDERLPMLALMPSHGPTEMVTRRLGERFLEGRACLWALPQGRLNADTLTRLSVLCQTHNAILWPVPGRRLLIVGAFGGIPEDYLRALGLIDAADHPLSCTDLCAGLDCPRSGLDTHEAARRLSALLAVLPQPISVHLSGCPKRCARDTPALLTLSGDDRDNLIRVIIGGMPGQPSLFETCDTGVLWRQLSCLIKRVADTPERYSSAAHWISCWQALSGA